MHKDPKQFDWNSVGFDFGNWEEEKLWALDIPVSVMPIRELEWHLDCPFWTNDDGERWTVTPRDVLEKRVGTRDEQRKVEVADTMHPIDIYFNKNKWLILDGIHRLTKQYQQGILEIKVRIVPDQKLPMILSNDPIELPSW